MFVASLHGVWLTHFLWGQCFAHLIVDLVLAFVSCYSSNSFDRFSLFRADLPRACDSRTWERHAVNRHRSRSAARMLPVRPLSASPCSRGQGRGGKVRERSGVASWHSVRHAVHSRTAKDHRQSQDRGYFLSQEKRIKNCSHTAARTCVQKRCVVILCVVSLVGCEIVAGVGMLLLSLFSVSFLGWFFFTD